MEGRTSEALTGFSEAMAGWNQAGVPMLTATTAFDMAAVLDPAIPEVAAAIEGARTIWAGVGAVGWTASLDRLPRRAGLRRAHALDGMR